MKTPVLILLLALSAALPAWGQDAPLPPAGYRERMPLRDGLSSEERERMRDTRQERRDAWRQMSPEDRHQLRRDIRDAGRTLYPRGPQRRNGHDGRDD
jgi:uncharacterized membrane protein